MREQLIPRNKYLRGYWAFNAFLFLVSLFLFVVVMVPRWLVGVSELSESLIAPVAEKGWVEKTFVGMSGEERVGQLFSVSLGEESEELMGEISPGFVGLFSEGSLERVELEERIGNWQETAKEREFVEILVMVDQEGGRVQRLKKGFERLPSLEEVCEEFGAAEIYELGKIVGEEMVGVGVGGVWGPVVDRTNSGSEVLRTRTCSDDPEEIIELVGEYARGLEEGGVLVVIKHYPGLGATSVDPHKKFGDVEKVDWEVFEPMALRATGVMVTHVGVGDDSLPCSVSGKCLAPLNDLRCKNGKCFLIFADAMEMGGVANKLSEVEAAYMAVMAGVDVLVYGAKSDSQMQMGVYEALVDLYESDPYFARRVDESVVRILRVKERFR